MKSNILAAPKRVTNISVGNRKSTTLAMSPYTNHSVLVNRSNLGKTLNNTSITELNNTFAKELCNTADLLIEDNGIC